MGTRFIHKGGRIIPIHSDHGDQQAPGAQHAKPANPPANPAPVAGHENTPHPAPVVSKVSVDTPVGGVSVPVTVDPMAKVREGKKKGHTFKAFGHSVTVK